MATVAQGASAQFVLGSEQSFTLTAAANSEGIVTVSPRVPRVVSQEIKVPYGPPTTSVVHGPYGCQCDVTITANVGGVDYSVAGLADVKSSIDPVTGGIDFLAGGEPLSTDGNPVPFKLRNRASGSSWLWKHPSTTQLLAASLWAYVPTNKAGYYAAFGIGNWGASAPVSPHLARFGLGCIGSYIKHDAGSGVTKTGTWTTSTLDYAPAGTASWSATAGDTISFATRGHTLVARSLLITNGGFAVVAVDGDYTSANRLPVFTQADADAGLCRSVDIGRRYIDTGATGIIPDKHFVIADGLSDTAHTVTFQATGTRGAYSSAARAYVGGVVGCSASDVGQNPSANATVFALVEMVQDAGASAMHYTPEVEKAAANNWEFLGEVHSGETQEAFEIYVDGADQSAISAGAYAGGSVIQIRRVSTLASTDAAATPVVRKTVKMSFGASQDVPCVATWKAAFLADKRVRSAYPLMLPIGNETKRTGGVLNNRWDALSFGTYKSMPSDFTGNAGVQRGKVPGLVAVASSSMHSVVAYAALLDGGRSVDYFALAAPSYVFMHDRSDGYDKTYFCRSTGQSIEKFASGDVIGGTVGFGVVKF